MTRIGQTPPPGAPPTVDPNTPGPKPTVPTETARPEAPLPETSAPPAALLPANEPSNGMAAVAQLAQHPLFGDRPSVMPATGPSLGPAPHAPKLPAREVLENLLKTLPQDSPAIADVRALLAMQA